MTTPHLRRTPHRQGNRTTWTFSAWVKNFNINSTGYLLYTTQASQPYLLAGRFLGNKIQSVRNESATVTELETYDYYRDPSAWMHVCITWDTTRSDNVDRTKIYINGVEQEQNGSWPSQNYEGGINNIVRHTLGSVELGNGNMAAGHDGHMCDVFFIDGQAYPPETFGYFKRNTGYDFNARNNSNHLHSSSEIVRGDWKAKRPFDIINKINESSGFGASGYYLPMNSSSNIGADFHTKPDTILKLKDNLPQPKAEIDGSGDYTNAVRKELGGLDFPGIVQFDGTSDYLTIPTSNDFAFGTGDFTIEFFTYLKSTQDCHFYEGRALQASRKPLIRLSSSSIRYYNDGADRIIGPKLSASQWYHIALSRVSGVSTLFVNGTSVGTYNDSIDILAPTTNLIIASNESGNNRYVDGYISNLRVIKGTALYNYDFTPPKNKLKKKTFINDGRIWSDGWSSGTTNPLNSFNGSLSDFSGSTGGTFTHTYTFASPLITKKKVEVAGALGATVAQVGHNHDVILINGKDITYKFKNANGYLGSTWIDVTEEVDGKFESIQIKGLGGVSNGSIRAIRIDNEILRDNFIPTNSLLCCNSEDDVLNEETGKTITTNGDVYATTSELTDNIVLALPFVHGGLQDGFGDYSAEIRGRGTPHIVTSYNNGGYKAHITTSNSLYYGSCLSLNMTPNTTDTNQWVRINGSSDFSFPGDFTFEFWTWPDKQQLTNARLFGCRTNTSVSGNGFDVTLEGLAHTNNQLTNTLSLVGVGGTQAGGYLITEQWNHVVFQRKGSRIFTIINGVVQGKFTNTTTIGNDSFEFRIGQIGSAYVDPDGYEYRGFMSDVRIYKGIAKYPSGGFDCPKPWQQKFMGESWRVVSDSPGNNFATLNKIDLQAYDRDGDNVPTGTITSGSLKTQLFDNSASARATMGVSSGKWYWEVRIDDNNNSTGIGIVGPGDRRTSYDAPSGQSFEPRNSRYRIGGTTITSGGANYTSDGIIVGVALDKDAGSISYYVDGVHQRTIENINALSKIHIPECFTFNDGVVNTYSWNFGQNPTFCGKIGSLDRLNGVVSGWDQSPNTGNHNDWSISNTSRTLSVSVSSGYYARAYMYLDNRYKYLLSFDYTTGPANLGIQTDIEGYIRATDGSLAPNGLSSGNTYIFEIANANQITITGFSGSSYTLNNIYVTRIDPGYSDVNGIGEFRYEPPKGYLALCSANLPKPAITDPGKYFKTVLYSGDNTEARKISGVGFQPDLVWHSTRNQAVSNILTDSVRGTQKMLSTDTTAAEQSPTYPYLNSFDSDGFSLRGGTNSGGNINGRSMVAWCWKAGGPAVENTDGSITSQVSANQDAGFSIVSTNGSGTAGHGLNATPQFIIQKRTASTSDWSIQHHKMMTTSTGKLLFSTAGVVASSTPYMFNANATTFEPIYTDPCISYCWTEIEGFSNFGSYTGNGETDGIFVYCGFKPAWVMIKSIDYADHWLIADRARDARNNNDTTRWLYPVSNAAESTQNGIELVSNGFKVRNSNNGRNGDNINYVYVAFAASPFDSVNAK